MKLAESSAIRILALTRDAEVAGAVLSDSSKPSDLRGNAGCSYIAALGGAPAGHVGSGWCMMRRLVGFLCVCGLGGVPLLGCTGTTTIRGSDRVVRRPLRKHSAVVSRDTHSAPRDPKPCVELSAQQILLPELMLPRMLGQALHVVVDRTQDELSAKHERYRGQHYRAGCRRLGMDDRLRP